MIVSSLEPITFVGGADLDPEDMNIQNCETMCYVAVDSGADHLLARGITPAAVIGDFDSLSDAARTAFGDRLYHIAEQSTVDFEKALTRVAAPLIYAVGFAGGRLDHTLAVLHVMGRHPDKPVILLSGQDASAIIPMRGLTLDIAIGARISLMPLMPSKVRASGLKWDVNDQTLSPLGFTSPSNAAAHTKVTLQSTGCVIVTVPRLYCDALAKALLAQAA